GLTPLEGLVMGTRSGDMDPAIMEFIADQEGITMAEVMNVLNKKSGVLGLSGISSDFRDVRAEADTNKNAANALEVHRYRVAKYIGAYAAAMNGVDAIAFTAGLGENDDESRAAIAEYLGYLGAYIDPVKNDVHGEEAIISTDDSKVTLLAIPTNEEIMIARDTAALAK
ncbi:MAG: acetate kinase, partial [Lachnospiraceae bacterium]|nr:acetate kinase [Lachnospiraceae bacterium]